MGNHAITAVVLVLPGGRETSYGRVHRLRAAHLRMLPFARRLRAVAHRNQAVVWQLRYRYRGWNGQAQDPVRDVEWALERAAERYPSATVILIGHSMGGRAALRAAGADNVVAVCALAPWLPPGEPVEQLKGRTVLIVHGDQDGITDPAASGEFAQRAGDSDVAIRMVLLVGDGHAMLRRPKAWTRQVVEFTEQALAAAAA